MKTLAVANQKGGACKTTTAWNLAACLAAKQKRVLVLDLDPQGAATGWAGVDEVRGGGTVAIFQGADLADLALASNLPGVDIIPADLTLEYEARDLPANALTKVAEAVRRTPAGKWDWLIIDTPPTAGILAAAALAAADSVLVPLEAKFLALRGLELMLDSINNAHKVNPGLQLAGILACRVNNTLLAREVVEHLREKHGSTVYQTVIRENVRLAECPSYAKPIIIYALDSAGAADYLAATAELLKREQEGNQ